MRPWMALLAMIPACGFESDGKNGGDGGGTPDASPRCFGSFVTVCFTTLADVPKTPVMLPADLTIEIDTDIGTSTSTPPLMCDQHNDQMAKYCIIAGAGVTVPAGQSIRAHGSKPLVLLSTTTIDLQGIVDVSSKHNSGPTNIGAGANPPGLCTETMAADGKSGGFGGSFGGQGGNGQAKDGKAGMPAAPLGSFPDTLRGGCPGGAGSTTASGSAMAGAGGSGGGAVAIIAAVKIDFNNKINASGAGGLGGSADRSGGGGGGSGGMIVLDAPSIAPGANGLVFANGGGGAEGGAGTGNGGTAAAGAPGGESAGPTMSAPKGGTTATQGGDGGDGSSGTPLDGAPAAGQSSNDGGGGAGGGGAGFVYAPGVANIAPPSKSPPRI